VQKAVEDADLFSKNYGAQSAAENARVRFAIAMHHIEREDFAAAKKALQGSMAMIDKSGSLDVRIRAHAALGRALMKGNDVAGATKEYDVVRGLWKDWEAATKSIEGQGGPDDARMKRLGHALTAVGEAHFFFAEQKRKDVNAIRFPEYKGDSSRESILTHTNTKVREWMYKKKAALEETEKAYSAILSLQPVPPPRWVIASAARVGMMWGKFVAEFRAAPIPKEWTGTGNIPGTEVSREDLRKEYYEKLDEASEPQKQHARDLFLKCQSEATKYGYDDEYARHCSTWLEKNK